MASAAVTKKLREEATCPICLELMTEPVIIDCEHIYCRVCIVGFIKNQSSQASSLKCPQCRESFKRDSIRPNRHLASIIETIKETERERLCEKHGEQLLLFCEDDGQLICWRCEHSPEHRGHVTALVEDVCQGYREQLQKAVTKLKVTESKYKQLKLDTTQKISCWEETIRLEKRRIHSEFKVLQTFLHQEKELYICRLEKERVQKLRRLQDNVSHLDNKLQELENHIQEMDKKCQGSAQNLLQDIKDTLDSNSAIDMETPEDVSVEVHTVCNVSELYFSVRKMLKRYQVTVTLDLDTANERLYLSADERGVTQKEKKKQVFISEQFSAFPCILGHEHFTSGRHYFEVDVRKGTKWSVGVCLENVPWDIDIERQPQSGFWVIRMAKDKGNLVLTYPPITHPLMDQPQIVGITLDCDAGIISFYNATTGSHIYTFPKASFSHALRPYFEVHPFSSLSLISSNE
ncbi:E3 ubiquitin-protein ligase TRIM38-like [Sorex araneus]|uniref:E3 ubiquitin-protein ligase TRIM38-like n=1 Tax=Sorex araneus TaxID=42254 RepID=UPI002433AAED|nr:E3 ubiquitin-protein ligase TRIM38-like [Sorex araneus]